MSSNKATLKAAKAALDQERWDEAITQSQIVLASDSQNYFAKLFLGRALDKKGDPDEAAKVYEAATKIKPNDDQAWQGLRSVYEAQGLKQVDRFIDVSIRLAELYAGSDDAHRCQVAVDKMVDFVRVNGTRAQYKRTLEVQLPTSQLYDFLEGRLPHPSQTYLRLAEVTENEEKERINKEIGERRTRLGARIGQVTTEVKREVFQRSNLEEIYQNVIDWTNEDEVRRTYEEKLFQRAYDTLSVLPKEKKAAKRDQVIKLAHGMVIIKHPFKLAWRVELEWRDVERFEDWDVGILRDFIELFPDQGSAKVLRAYLTSDLSPFGAVQQSGEAEDEEPDPTVSLEDILLLMSDGIDEAKDSPLAYRLMTDYYLHLEEYESATDTARRALGLLRTESQVSGLGFQENADAIQNMLATALIYHSSPRNHPEAKQIFHSILSRKPRSMGALMGIGLILEQEEEYAEAAKFFGHALDRDPENVRIGTERSWCDALSGHYAEGMEKLESYLPRIRSDTNKDRQLKAQTLYRIGKCLWELDPSRASRKDRSGAYARFLSAIKTDVNLAPPYTSLGIYYEDYAKDKKRARQCFQKAFELSVSEVEAAERLARSFADQGDWDVVEMIAQRVIESGRARPLPGSKKKGLSWPYSALGVVQMSWQDYSQSAVSFLAALRISPDDYHSYVGLGESYHNSGRYNSAARALRYAEDPDDHVIMKHIGDRWFTKYMLANVNRETGEFEEAIQGYRDVLQDRPDEYGVSIALLQTHIEHAWRNIESGLFGQAVKSATEAISLASSIGSRRPDAFNLWKSLGDACSIFSWFQHRAKDFPFAAVRSLLETGLDTGSYDIFAEFDHTNGDALFFRHEESNSSPDGVVICLEASILAQKRAIHVCSHDVNARAVAMYNLGWAEYRMHCCVQQGLQTKVEPGREPDFLKAALRCFKRAIELEAGNAEFWNALGIATAQLNAKVAQHSFVRSLHLNEKNAQVWTNLGALCLMSNDVELAHSAFARAQSTDPDYAHAWVGEGLIALLVGDGKEALSHFMHAFEISDSSSLLVKQQYSQSMFDQLVSSPASSNNILNLVQPLFALQQLHLQTPTNSSYQHLAALLLERVGKHDDAIEALTSVCAEAEAEYEVSESASSLEIFAQGKADLARNQLAAHEYLAAVSSAEVTLGLTSDAEPSGLRSENWRKMRLSAHLTAGLGHYYLAAMDQAMDMFRQALEESDSAADVVCLLAQVLWAKGGEDEKAVAREQLLDCIEKHPSHVNAVVLLGVVSILEDDKETLDAVKDDLHSLRTSADLDTRQLRKVEKVLDAIAAILLEGAGDENRELSEVMTSIMLSPSQPHGWSQLAAMTEDRFAAEMALGTALRAVPPNGPLDSVDLAKAFAGTGTAADAQRAIMLAPWITDGWESFGAVLA